MLLIYVACLHKSDAQQLRLVEGWNRCVGRIEVYYEGIWGTVCDDFFNMNNGHVVCSQLDCGEATSVPGWSYFGQGSGNISLDNVNCTGSELYLWDCPHAGWFTSDCEHNEDVSVVCSDAGPPPTGQTTYESTSLTMPSLTEELSLPDGPEIIHETTATITPSTTQKPSSPEGPGTIHETTHSITPSTTQKPFSPQGPETTHETIPSMTPSSTPVSSSPEGSEESPKTILPTMPSSAKLTSQYNGSAISTEMPTTFVSTLSTQYPDTASATSLSTQQPTTIPVSTSTSLSSTQKHTSSGNQACGGSLFDHSGSFCSPLYPSHYPSNSWCVWIIQVQENHHIELIFDDFRVEIARICRFDFVEIFDGPFETSPSLEKICFSSKKTYISSSNKMRIVFSSDSSVNDRGFHATYRTVPPKNTLTKPTPALKSTTLTERAVKLVNGRNRCEGRVEVLYNGRWGTVCDDSWDLNDAHVVCRQLGCGQAVLALGKAPFGPGSGSIFLDDLSCNGYEISLDQCIHRGWGKHNCLHSEDAGIRCSGLPQNIPVPTEGAVKLVNGKHRCEGRLEIFHNAKWGTVCDDSWDINDAHVVCRQLGCGEALSAPGNARFGRGLRFILMDDVSCSGNEMRLAECSFRGWGIHNCFHKEDASVICSAFPPPSTTKLATTTALLEDTTNLVTLSCLREYMRAVIKKQYLTSKGCLNYNLYLSEPACKPVITRYEFIFFIPYDGCGTRRENNGKISSFSNTVSSSGNHINPQFHFICKMEPRTMKEVMHNIDELESTNQGAGFHVKFLFYDSSSFGQPLNNMGYFMNLNQDIFIQATLYSFNKNLILFTDTCVASPNAYDFTTENYVIINRGCIIDSTYVNIFSKDRRIIRFRFKPFRFYNSYSTVYLQCKIVVCQAWDYSSRCYKGCLSRSKRETSSGQELVQILGPFTLKK